MSDYRRLISYIYEYEGNVKGKNIGFVKLEARNGQCRLHVNAKRVYVGGNAIGVYLLGQGGVKTFLGNMFVRNGVGDFHIAVDAGNVEGTGNPMDTYYGLTVHDVKNDWREYRTIWADVELEEVEAAEAVELVEKEAELDGKEPELDGKTSGLIEGNSESIEAKIESPKEDTEIFEDSTGKDEEKIQYDKIDSGMQFTAQEVLGADSEVSSIETMMISPELENPDVLRYLQESEQTAPNADTLWQELRKMFPKIQPFDHDCGNEALTIRPDDIGRLPRECWIYGNNSFLLHGYYNYRYLILVRLEQAEGSARYLLGVPGHYYSNEKYMATMFGFPNFVLSKKQPPNDGRFGYWYTDVKMGQ